MSWWETSNGSVLGDRPADILRRSLRDLVAARKKMGKPKPTLADILAAVAALGAGYPPDMFGKQANAPFHEIVALWQDQRQRLSVPVGSPTDPDIEQALRNSFDAIMQEYQRQWQRQPTFNELLDTLAFVLRYRPDDFLSHSGGMIDQIVAR